VLVDKVVTTLFFFNAKCARQDLEKIAPTSPITVRHYLVWIDFAILNKREHLKKHSTSANTHIHMNTHLYEQTNIDHI
jgi:hypothetical protein